MKEKKKKESGQDLCPWEGIVKEEMFTHPGKLLHWQGDQPGWKGSFRGSKESAVASSWHAEQRETCTEGPGQLHALPSPRCMSAGVCRGWVLKLRLQRTDLGSRLGMATWRQPEGAGVRPKPQPGVCRGRSLGLPLKPHC